MSSDDEHELRRLVVLRSVRERLRGWRRKRLSRPPAGTFSRGAKDHDREQWTGDEPESRQ
jgi:hypothetical protein